MKKIISLIMCICILITSLPAVFAEEQELLVTTLDYFTEEDIKNTADRLFSKIDDNSYTAEIVKTYKAGEYLKALGLFRNYMIDRFRATPQEKISITGFSWDYYYLTADIMVGRMTREELNEKYAHRADLKKVNAADVEHILDYIDSSQPSHIVWVNRDKMAGDERLLVHNDHTHGIAVLACRYAATGDPVFLLKALQIMEDIADNCAKQIDEFYGITDLSFDERGYMAKTLSNNGVYMYNKEGSRAASYNVNRAQRSNCFWWTLNIIAKCLPGGYEHTNRHSNYHNTVLPMTITEKPSQEGYNLVDPVRFAKFITLIIEKEYPTMTKSVLDKPGGTPNIELEAKRNSLRYAAVLKDFSSTINEFLPDLITAVNERMSETTYIDGGALETSFNYNDTDIGGREAFAKTINTLAPEFVTKYGLDDFSQQAVRYERLKELYSSPLGLLSRVGNVYSVYGTAPVWKNEEKLAALKEKLGDTKQAYTSAYLPYSGYGSMRSGWDTDDFYMSFYNNDRFTSGHGFMGRNAVMNLTAHNRTLLMCGGVPYYGLSYVTQYPEFVENGYDEINAYFSEDSTRKTSTVMVNDKSQSIRDFIFDDNGDYDVNKNTGNKWGFFISATDNRILRSRWLTDDHYDFAEGTYDGGYTYMYGKVENIMYPSAVGQVTKDAQHDRDFIYVKDADLFIVTDTMTNTYSLANKYRGLWHFPAYLEGVENLSGFKEEQVILNEEKNMFYTDDAEGPNLYAYNFSNSDLSYEKYCGYFKKGEIAWGWGDGGNDETLGNFTPRPEVHVLWNDQRRGDVTKVSTVLAPSENNTNPIVSSIDKSTDDMNAFELTTKDGITVKYFSFKEKTKLEFDGIKVRAKDLIITQGADGKYKSAVALDCDYFISNNVTPMYMISDNCSVEFKENGLIGKVTQFDVPTGFKWVDTEDGKYIPSYKSE